MHFTYQLPPLKTWPMHRASQGVHKPCCLMDNQRSDTISNRKAFSCIIYSVQIKAFMSKKPNKKRWYDMSVKDSYWLIHRSGSTHNTRPELRSMLNFKPLPIINFLASPASRWQVSLAIGLWLLYIEQIIASSTCLTAHVRNHGVSSFYMPWMWRLSENMRIIFTFKTE